MASETLQQAIALIQSDQLFEAMPLLNEVLEQQPGCVAAYVQRAKIRRRLGDRESAIADYTKAINLTPTAEAYLARALVWLSLEQLNGVVSDAQKAAKLAPNLAGGHRLLGKALGLLGDGPGAIAAYKQAARCYLDSQDKSNAQACLDAIGPLQKLPPLPKLPAEQSLAPKKTAGAATEQPAKPAEYMRLVQVKYDAGEYAAAMKDLTWLLNIDPNYAKALCLRGLIQAQLGRREQAIGDMSLAMRQAPDDESVRFARGQMRLILKDYDGAIEELSALITATETPNARYFSCRGDCYRGMEEPESAFKDYSNALAIDTENAQLYEQRAKMQSAMGAREGAIADYQQAATLWLNQGDWKQHQRVVDKVRELRSQAKTKSRAKNSATVTIKTYERNMPVVEVLLDGKAAFDVVIDRNATHSIVTKSMATKLNLDMVSYRYVYLADGTPMELPIGRLRSVVVGSVIVTDVYVAILPERGKANAPDKATPVLGKDCFSAYSIRISGNEMTFMRP
ncbi:MAG: tetratricopeptide repeat protein [Cyanobacteria bacterium J06597_16]